MKKSLLAVAVAAALPAAAFAQSNVQLYGIVDAFLEYSNDAANASGDAEIKLQNGLQSGSRLGVRGSEDLGGGLSANFMLEHRLNVDDGAQSAAAFWHGQARVGLKGGFGEVRLGRQYTPIFYTSIVNDYSGFAFYNNHVGLAGDPIRLSNMVEYRNKFGGIEVIGAWAPGEGVATTTTPAGTLDDTFGLGLIYDGGAWGVSGGYQSQGQTNGDSATVIHVGGKFNFGPFGIGLNYGDGSDLVGGDRTEIAGSVGMKVGASGNVVLNIVSRDRETGNDQLDIGLSYAHAISKRTNWYAAYGMDRIDNVEDPMWFAVGVRHRF